MTEQLTFCLPHLCLLKEIEVPLQPPMSSGALIPTMHLISPYGCLTDICNKNVLSNQIHLLTSSPKLPPQPAHLSKQQIHPSQGSDQSLGIIFELFSFSYPLHFQHTYKSYRFYLPTLFRTQSFVNHIIISIILISAKFISYLDYRKNLTSLCLNLSPAM